MAEPMERLRAELAEARAIYDSRAKTPDGEAGPQAGAVNAIDAVITFLVASEVPLSVQDPLLVVLAAFRDHSRGKPHPLFAIDKKAGRRLHSQENAWRAYVAAAVQLLVDAGVKKQDALANVADSLRKSGIAGVTKMKVDTWHREISSDRQADHAIIKLYRNMLDQTDPANPRLAAEKLLATLPIVKL